MNALVNRYTAEELAKGDITTEPSPPEPAPEPPAQPGDDVLLAFIGRVARVAEPVEPAADHRVS